LVFSNIIAFSISWKIQQNRQRNYRDLITNKQKHLALKEHAEKLQSLVLDSERLAIVGATANMVGHDMRSPLTTINCQIYLAKKNLRAIPEKETIVKLEKNLELISDEAQYLSDLVNDIQDFSKVLIPKLEEIRIETFISPLLTKLKIPEQITVQISIEPASLVIVTDASFLRRILTNLINNALQAMPKGGQLTIKAYRDISDDLNISVEDSGQGIPEEARTKIFTPLFTTKHEGHGFGLASAKRMTEALDGTIIVESQINKGSKFTVKLPFKKVP
jgi:signal transduction histidine kinase